MCLDGHGVRVKFRRLLWVEDGDLPALLAGVADGRPSPAPDFLVLGHGRGDHPLGLIHDVAIAGDEGFRITDFVIESRERSVLCFFRMVRRVAGMTDDEKPYILSDTGGLFVRTNRITMMKLLAPLCAEEQEQSPEIGLLLRCHPVSSACESYFNW